MANRRIKEKRARGEEKDSFFWRREKKFILQYFLALSLELESGLIPLYLSLSRERKESSSKCGLIRVVSKHFMFSVPALAFAYTRR